MSGRRSQVEGDGEEKGFPVRSPGEPPRHPDRRRGDRTLLRRSPHPALWGGPVALLLPLMLLAACGGNGNGEAGRPGPEADRVSTADPDLFLTTDSARVMAELQALAHDSMEGRRTGTAGAEKARVLIQKSLEAAGVFPAPGGFRQPFRYRSRRDTAEEREGVNVVGFVPGTREEAGAIVITAHFDHLGIRAPRRGRRGGSGEPVAGSGADDSVESGREPPASDSIYNGADDNASGVVALLSMARYFALHPPLHTMVFAALDGEEVGSVGARAFLELGWPDSVTLNVNLDMVSRSDSLLFAAGTSHYPWLRPVLETVHARGPVVLRFGHDRRGVPGEQDWTGSSDHGPFHRAGIPFVYFGVEDHEDYHRPSDEFEAVDPAFFVNAVRTILAAVVALDKERAAAERPRPAQTSLPGAQ